MTDPVNHRPPLHRVLERAHRQAAVAKCSAENWTADASYVDPLMRATARTASTR